MKTSKMMTMVIIVVSGGKSHEGVDVSETLVSMLIFNLRSATPETRTMTRYSKTEVKVERSRAVASGRSGVLASQDVSFPHTESSKLER